MCSMNQNEKYLLPRSTSQCFPILPILNQSIKHFIIYTAMQTWHHDINLIVDNACSYHKHNLHSCNLTKYAIIFYALIIRSYTYKSVYIIAMMLVVYRTPVIHYHQRWCWASNTSWIKLFKYIVQKTYLKGEYNRMSHPVIVF